MWRAPRDADAAHAADHGLEREPVDRRAFALRTLGDVLVHGERERHVACDHQVVEQRVAAAHRNAVLRHQLAEEADTFFLAHVHGHRGVPLRHASLEAELALPLGIEQVLIGARKVLLAHEVRVVGLDPERQVSRGPAAMRALRATEKLHAMRRRHRLQYFLAVERLHLERRGVHRIEIVPSGAGLDHGALQHLFRCRAPELHVDAIALLESGGQAGQVLLGKARVQHERAFRRRRRDDLLQPVSALVAQQGRVLRKRRRRDGQAQEK